MKQHLRPAALSMSACHHVDTLIRFAALPPPSRCSIPAAQAPADGMSPRAAAIATQMARAGQGPAAQLHAAKIAQPSLTYRPHQGAKERARRAARMGLDEAPAKSAPDIWSFTKPAAISGVPAADDGHMLGQDRASMPPVSERQNAAMHAAANGKSTLGIPKAVGTEFTSQDEKPIASGIVFVAPDGEVLLLRRASTEENYAGHWSLPGGKADEGESATDCAIRETKEEIGQDVDADAHGLKLLDCIDTPNGMRFSTYAKAVDEKFAPKLNAEHSGFTWSSLDTLPRPLHPGVERVLGEHIGVTEDMKPEEWSALRDGFAKWTREEEREPEHAGDASFNEADHPRAQNGKFGSGSGAKTPAEAETLAGALEKKKRSAKTDHDKLALGFMHSVANIDSVISPEARKTNAFSYIERGGEIVGAGRAKILGDGIAEITAVGSLAKGAGKEAVSDLIEQVRKKGATEIRLTAETGSAGFYEKMGFTNKGDDEYVMHLKPEHAAGADARIAFDRSVRTYDKDGRLRVERVPITKANVCEYWGYEIPLPYYIGDVAQMQIGASGDPEPIPLDPNKKYSLLRSPEELKRAAASWNGVQLMVKHVPVDADDHKPDLIVGSVGTDGEWQDPYVYNSLMIWAREGIDGIEDNSQRQLSSAYHYRADMTPGEFRGIRYHGIMRDLVGNHVILCPEGRAGADVVVGDSKLKTQEFDMSKIVLSRKGVQVGAALAVMLKPRMAADAKFDATPLLKDVTAKNFKAKKADIAKGVRAGVKLAKDAKLDDLEQLLDMIESEDVAEGADADPKTGAPMSAEDMEKNAKDEAEKAAKDKKSARDAEVHNFLKDKGMSAEDMAAYDAMMDEDDEAEDEAGESETEEEKAKRMKAEAKDKKGRDEAPEKKPEGVSKAAMDAAIARNTAETEQRVITRLRAVQDAVDAVDPYVGKLAMACDSAEDVYRVTLTTLGQDEAEMKALPLAALKAILKAQPKLGDRAPSRMAHDSAGREGFAQRFPNAANIRVTG